MGRQLLVRLFPVELVPFDWTSMVHAGVWSLSKAVVWPTFGQCGFRKGTESEGESTYSVYFTFSDAE